MKYPLSREAAERLILTFEYAVASTERNDVMEVKPYVEYADARANLLDALTGYCSHVKD